jgi:hypothetical protein
LLQGGAQVYIKKKRETHLHCAAFGGHARACFELLQGACFELLQGGA